MTNKNRPYHQQYINLFENENVFVFIKMYNKFLHVQLFPCKRQVLSSADNLCKQFGPRSGPTKSASERFDTLIVLQKEFFLKVNFEKKSQQTITQARKIIQHAKRFKTVKSSALFAIKILNTFTIKT